MNFSEWAKVTVEESLKEIEAETEAFEKAKALYREYRTAMKLVAEYPNAKKAIAKKAKWQRIVLKVSKRNIERGNQFIENINNPVQVCSEEAFESLYQIIPAVEKDNRRKTYYKKRFGKIGEPLFRVLGDNIASFSAKVFLDDEADISESVWGTIVEGKFVFGGYQSSNASYMSDIISAINFAIEEWK